MSRYLVVVIMVAGWSMTALCKQLEVSSALAVTSIAKAISQASPFDTICVNAGVNNTSGAIVIGKPITLLACGKAVVNAAENSGIFEVRADSVTIAGFTFQDVPRSYTKDLAAIWVDFSKHFTISDNSITNCFFAIFCTKSKNGLIQNNKVSGNAVQEASSANAIHLWYCDSIDIQNNTVQHHRDGIYLEFTGNSRIQNNISRHNLRYGLHFMFSNNDVYRGNTFTDNGAGVAVMFSDHIEMVENRFLENWGRAAYGLLLKEIYDSKIEGNLFSKNTTGIFSEGSSRIIMKENEFKSNGWAVKMRGSSMDNELTRNNFIGNSFNVATDAKTDHNTYIRNYWDDYRGYDLNRDGLGDIPHRPVNLFSYLASRIDESIILLRSSFIEILNFTEKVAPAVTPTNLVDKEPLMAPVSNSFSSLGD